MFTKKDRRELVSKLEEHKNSLLEVISGMNHENADKPWKESDRSPKGQLLHLVEAEHLYVTLWAKRSRDEDSPDLSIASSDLSNEAISGEDPLKSTLEELTIMLSEQRRSTYKFIAETSDDEMELLGMNTPFGNLSIHQFLKSLYKHDQMHQDEINGTESSYIVTNQDGKRL